MDQKEINRLFYRDGFRLALHHLDQGLSAGNLRAAIKKLYLAVDELLESFLQRVAREGRASDCRQGCAWCCHQEVFAVTHEFLYLREYADRELSGESRAGVLARAREKERLTVNRPLEEQLKVRVACPFLEAGSCLAYEARPMACRIYLSSSVSSCQWDHDHPGNGTKHPDLYEFPLQAGRMLNEGFVAGLKQMGLQVGELPIEQGYASMVAADQNMEDWIGQAAN